MQHSILPRLLAAIIMLTTAISCSKEGPQGTAGPQGQQGPQGQPGPQGTPGQNGTANAWSYIYTNQVMAAPTLRNVDPATGNFIFTAVRNLRPDRYQAIAPNGIVLIYLRKAGATNEWKLSQLPQIRQEPAGGQSTLLFDSRLMIDNAQIVGVLDTPVDDRNWLETASFDAKIILVEATSTTNLRTVRQLPVDVRDAGAVEKYFNIRY